MLIIMIMPVDPIAQLHSIQQTTLARIFCDNLDDAKTMQPNILAHPKSVARAL